MIILIVLVVLLALGVLLYHHRGNAETRTYRHQHRQLTKQLAAATSIHTTAIKTATGRAKQARTQHANRVRDLERALENLHDPDGHRITTYRGITLNELTIRTPQGLSNLAGANATVDTAGNLAVTRRATLTRTGAGLLIAGPLGALIGGVGFKKKQGHDSRELYLLIETPTLVTSIQCPPDDGAKARAFAAKINTAARQAEQLTAARPQQITDTETALAAARADTTAIETAEQQLAAVTADPTMLDAIQTARQAVDRHALAAPARKALPAADHEEAR